jgi:hypothetical protein
MSRLLRVVLVVLVVALCLSFCTGELPQSRQLPAGPFQSNKYAIHKDLPTVKSSSMNIRDRCGGQRVQLRAVQALRHQLGMHCVLYAL